MEDGEDTQLYSHLGKLTAIRSEQEMEDILNLLWKTRKTGISPADKSLLHSLLNLESIPQLDPVLACLRILLRKFVRENLSSANILKLFPQSLSLELQNMLITLLYKHENEWKEGYARDQALLSKSKISNKSPLKCLPHERAVSQVHDRLEYVPQLKSINWTLENQSPTPMDSAAIISLHLQDDNKSHSGKTDVKFRVSRESLDEMISSLAYIKEKLPPSGTSCPEPLNKKQKQ